MKKVKSLLPRSVALSDKAKAKLARDYETAKADPATKMLVDNLNRNASKSAKR